MGSRVDTTPHDQLLGSFVVRPTVSYGEGAGSDYEPGEVRRDPSPYFQSVRYDDHGYRMRASSVSPVCHRDENHRFSQDFKHSGSPQKSHGFGRGREPANARHSDYSLPYGCGRFPSKGYGRPTHGSGPIRRESLPRNNPNVQPREGDWICPDPSCKNLNFARREHCYSCNKSRYGPVRISSRVYPDASFPPWRQRFPSPPLNHSPRRSRNGGGYGSPPRFLPRDVRAARPPPRHNSRFPDPHPLRGDIRDYSEDDSRDRDRYRYRHDRPNYRGRRIGRDNYFNDRREYGRRALSPPIELRPPRDWAPHIRGRSRSPVRGGDYHRDIYMNRGRDDREEF
ncbi:hypothetical protein ACJIZ3_021191 [Penstemon smallii]|uniref:RanBP2-type domain-containing protein n=1 Tax=Penstemon smallii TaxID=265156 RepID=A0ABD3SL19_9LAMI